MSEKTSAGVALGLDEFAALHAQKSGDGAWQLESPRCLEVHLAGETVRTKVGGMIAYRGDLKFERAGSGGLGKFMKGMLTSESGRAAMVTGTGVLYLADASKEISILRLNGDVLFVNSRDLLAYSDDLEWDITVIKGAGIVAGGLFTFKLSGSGYAAITTHGNPLVLAVTPDSPLFTDPNATVAWSEGLAVNVKADVNMKTLTGRASGETWQMQFSGTGFVVVQPFEEGEDTRAGSAG
ncbi:MAG: AIM24 family protein [Coriobacteriia bacterium]|nr:AIM24 family protein [Coriobacteriia bacterium]